MLSLDSIQSAGFRKALNHLQYAKKWFQKLRAVLYIEGQSEEDRDLAPLSKMYHLTTEEAEMIPLRLSGFLQSVTQEWSRCKHRQVEWYDMVSPRNGHGKLRYVSCL